MIEKAADPIVILDMPGCILAEFNSAADRHFKSVEAPLEVRDDSARRPTCICESLGAANAYVESYCQLERGWKLLSLGRRWGPKIIGFHFNRGNGVREYRLYLIHTQKSRPQPGRSAEPRLQCRLMPLPAADFKVTVTDIGKSKELNSGAIAVPAAVHVKVGNSHLWRSSEIRYDSKSIFDPLRQAYGFSSSLVRLVESGRRPSEAWCLASQEYPTVGEQMHTVTDLFQTDDKDALPQLMAAWKSPLDAPVLLDCVYPSIYEAIRNDRGLQFLPVGEDNEEVPMAYLRARMPLAQLEDEDGIAPAAPAVDLSTDHQQYSQRRILRRLSVWDSETLQEFARAVVDPQEYKEKHEEWVSATRDDLREMLTAIVIDTCRSHPGRLTCMLDAVSQINREIIRKGLGVE